MWLVKNVKLEESQAGFSNQRRTRDHVYTLNTIINNKLKVKVGKLHFTDFAAFNSMDREVMISKIKRLGVNRRLFMTIGKLYSVTRNEMIT